MNHSTSNDTMELGRSKKGKREKNERKRKISDTHKLNHRAKANGLNYKKKMKKKRKNMKQTEKIDPYGQTENKKIQMSE